MGNYVSRNNAWACLGRDGALRRPRRKAAQLAIETRVME